MRRACLSLDAPYRGRFAPSPTGPLHLGSLVTALGSYADALAQGGDWLVRIEDLDRTREVPGAADAILRTLDACGFEWQGSVLYQSRRHRAYAEALAHLEALGLTYACACSRREIAAAGLLGPEGWIHRGRCHPRPATAASDHAIRLRLATGPLAYSDRVQGQISQDLAAEVGDFVLRRADGLHAYQLAVVVDDADQGITHIVRGADLVRSTPRQIYLQRLLHLPEPNYAHLPLALDGQGRKLSKADAAAPVDPRRPLSALLQAWAFLGQPVFSERPLLAEFWTLARQHWDLARVPRHPGLAIKDAGL